MAAIAKFLTSLLGWVDRFFTPLMPFLTSVHDVLIAVPERLDNYLSGTKSQGRKLPRSWAVAHIALAFFMIFGPCPRIDSVGGLWLIVQGCVLALLLTSASLVDQHVQNPRRLLRYVTWFFVTLSIVEFMLPVAWLEHLNYETPGYREADNLFFPNLWHLLGLIVMGVAWSARAVGRAMVEPAAQKFKPLGLAQTLSGFSLDQKTPSTAVAPAASISGAEMVNPEATPAMRKDVDDQATESPRATSVLTWFWETLFEALQHPLEVVLLPAMWIVLTDATWFDWLLPKWVIQASNVGVLVFLLTCAIVVMGTASRWPASEALSESLRRVFFRNGSWATSVLVILLAVLWLSDFSYVSTIMQGDRWVVIWYVLAIYALSLVYNFWVNLWLSDQLVEWIFARGNPDLLCIHGVSRFSVRSAAENQWIPIERTQLIADLSTEYLQAGLPPSTYKDLRVRMRAYYVLLNTITAALIVGMFVSGISYSRLAIVNARPLEDVPDVSDYAKDVFGKDSLKNSTELLFGKSVDAKADRQQRPQVILVAASGGGTRAALFTASVLEGLAQERQLQNVKLVSGVSGGGVALTYFAMHRDELLNTVSETDRRQRWDDFVKTMAHPYITDVLRGASEPRILWQSSIATLLAEGFSDEFNGNEISCMKDIQIGLMLNATIAGISPPEFPSETDNVQNGRYASSLHAGSRLVFTNLRDKCLFPTPEFLGATAGVLNQPVIPNHEFLLFEAVQDPEVKLVRAAALNANFPPIFPNAAVDFVTKAGDAPETSKRFWVTDGGAAENKGVIALLYALRSAIRGFNETQNASRSDCQLPASAQLVTSTELPDIHIVIADASGGGVEYQHDQGLGAAASAGGQLANQLANELTAVVKAEYAELQRNQSDTCPATITSHYIAMPSMLRLNGGIGTHWMMPERVRLREFRLNSNRRITDSSYELSREQLIRLIRELHWTDKEVTRRAKDEARRVKEGKAVSSANKLRKEQYDIIKSWIANDVLGNTHQRWAALVEALNRPSGCPKEDSK